MLVLSRRHGESVIIGDRQVRIQVIEIRGDKVRLGFEADDTISIHRAEVFEAIEREEERRRGVQ